MRRETWDTELMMYIHAVESTPFAWGEFDCVTFAAGCVEAMTGNDLMATIRGSYQNERGARRLLSSFGGLRAAISSVLGEPISPLLARRGDVVTANGPHGETTAVCIGARYIMTGTHDLVTGSMAGAIAAWRVE